jgi:hypothetical protein
LVRNELAAHNLKPLLGVFASPLGMQSSGAISMAGYRHALVRGGLDKDFAVKLREDRDGRHGRNLSTPIHLEEAR